MNVARLISTGFLLGASGFCLLAGLASLAATLRTIVLKSRYEKADKIVHSKQVVSQKEMYTMIAYCNRYQNWRDGGADLYYGIFFWSVLPLLVGLIATGFTTLMYAAMMGAGK